MKTLSGSEGLHVLGMLGNRHDAEDMTQQALLKGFMQIQTLRDSGRFAQWIARITVGFTTDNYMVPQWNSPLSLVDQVQERFARGFGDYLAVILQSVVRRGSIQLEGGHDAGPARSQVTRDRSADAVGLSGQSSRGSRSGREKFNAGDDTGRRLARPCGIISGDGQTMPCRHRRGHSERGNAHMSCYRRPAAASG